MRNRWLALLAAAWYALHPANAETVNYIIARSEILSTLGSLRGCCCSRGGGAARRYYLYLIPAVLADPGKESAAMFAPLLFLYVALFERQLSLRDLLQLRAIAAILRATWPAFLVCAGTVAFGLWMSTNLLARRDVASGTIC